MSLRLVTVCLVAVSVASCKGQTQAEQTKVPYATVYKAVTMQFEEINSLTNRQVRFAISSSLPDVEPKDIELYIDSKTGRIPLGLNPDGTFALPLRDALLKENPFIVANQPKGSLALQVDITLRGKIDQRSRQMLDEQHKARYRYLFSVNSVADQAYEHVSKALPAYQLERAKTASHFVFSPTPATNAPALIHSVNGEIQVQPDQDGVIRIEYDSKLARENPWVTFPSAGNYTMETMKETEKAEPADALDKQ